MHGAPPGVDAGMRHHQHGARHGSVAMRIVVQVNQIGLEPSFRSSSHSPAASTSCPRILHPFEFVPLS